MTTITTTQHQRTPLLAALAVGAALVVGGALGAAINQSSAQPSPAETHAAVTHDPLWGFGRYNYYHGPNAPFYDPDSHAPQQNVQPSGRQLGL